MLSCGGVLGQMISSMVEFRSSGRSAPNAAPIPDVAHSLIRSVIADLGERYSEQEIQVAAAIIDDLATAICNEIFIVSPDLN